MTVARARLEVVLGMTLILAGIVSAAMYRWVFVDPTSQSDWEDAAAWIAERADSNDAVRLEPHWHGPGLVALEPVGPLIDRTRAPLAEDLYDREEIFVAAQHDRVQNALDALPFAAEVVEQASFSTVTATRVAVPELGINWELYQNLEHARVSRVKGDSVTQCDKWDKRQRRWDCVPRNKWLYVGAVMREMGDEPRRCVWAHPLRPGGTLRIEFEPAPAQTVRIRAGFDLYASRHDANGEVLLQAFVANKLVQEKYFKHDDATYDAIDLNVADFGDGAPIRLEIDLVEGTIRDRFFCLNAWAIDPSTP